MNNTINLYGAERCHKTQYYKELLTEKGFQYNFYDVEENESYAEKLRSLYTNNKLNFPTITIGAKKLRNPNDHDLDKWLYKGIILSAILELPEGYTEVVYNNRKYGVTRTSFNNEKSFKVFAKELGGTDFISLNYYITNNSHQLKPCEMPEKKVIDFLTHFNFIEATTNT